MVKIISRENYNFPRFQGGSNIFFFFFFLGGGGGVSILFFIHGVWECNPRCLSPVTHYDPKESPHKILSSMALFKCTANVRSCDTF